MVERPGAARRLNQHHNKLARNPSNSLDTSKSEKPGISDGGQSLGDEFHPVSSRSALYEPEVDYWLTAWLLPSDGHSFDTCQFTSTQTGKNTSPPIHHHSVTDALRIGEE
jgi:hypothetical protein